jgi:hypothetical protein
MAFCVRLQGGFMLCSQLSAGQSIRRWSSLGWRTRRTRGCWRVCIGARRSQFRERLACSALHILMARRFRTSFANGLRRQVLRHACRRWFRRLGDGS